MTNQILLTKECKDCEHRVVRYNFCPVIEEHIFNKHSKPYSDHIIVPSFKEEYN